MNPKDFGWEEDQTVTVINPTKEKHEFQVHGKSYEVAAGGKAKMPGYIAWLYVYTLASKMCQAKGQFGRWNEEGFKQTYFEPLVDNVEGVVNIEVVEPKSEVEDLTVDDETTEDEEATDESGDDSESEQPKKTRRGRKPRVA